MTAALLFIIVAQIEQGSVLPADKTQPPALSSQIFELLGPTFTKTSFGGWLLLFAGIFVGLAAGRIIQSALRKLGDRWQQRGWTMRAAVFQHGAGPASLALFAMGLGAGFQGLYFEPTGADPKKELYQFLLRFVAFLNIVAIGWFAYNLVDLIDLALRRLTIKSATKLDDTVVTLLRKALRIFVLIMFLLFVAQNFFGANITAWLAGLGIAGLAVSLAAQDSIKNLFGSMTVLIERPFGLGDRIIFGGYDGVVETIGFRSSKIRTLGGHLVTLPNMRFTDGTIENISARPFIVRTFEIGLTYDTLPAKVAQAIEIVGAILNEPEIAQPLNVTDRPPRVCFKDFGPSSLNLQIVYAYAIKAPGRDMSTYMDHAQLINLKILQAFNDAAIDFAYPTHTVHLAGQAQSQLDGASPRPKTGNVEVKGRPFLSTPGIQTAYSRDLP